MKQSTRQNTKTALVRAAERLFAEKGLGTVSVKDITRAAGARNPSAVHYHFGNVEELIKAVFDQRLRAIEAERLEQLHAVDETDPVRRVIALMQASVAPFMGTCLEEEGRLYVRFCIQFASDPRFDLTQMVEQGALESLYTLQQQVLASIADLPAPLPAPLVVMRLRQCFNISLMQAADFSHRIELGKASPLDQVVRECAATLAGYLMARPLEDLSY